MSKTWAQMKTEVLELMFSSTKKGVPITSASNNDYIIAMPTHANVAMRELAEIKPIIKKYQAVQVPLVNMIDDSGALFTIKQIGTSDDSYEVTDPGSYYFEAAGGYVDVYLEKDTAGSWVEVDHIAEEGSLTYKAYSGLISDAGTYRLRFSLDDSNPYRYSYKNIAFYAETFADDEDVQAYKPFFSYDLKELLASAAEPSQFKAVYKDCPVELESDYTVANVTNVQPMYLVRGDHVVLLSRHYKGQVTFYYVSYPTRITTSTADAFHPELADEALDAVVLYIAGMLMGQLDQYLSGRYIEQYKLKQAELKQDPDPTGDSYFISESGWV